MGDFGEDYFDDDVSIDNDGTFDNSEASMKDSLIFLIDCNTDMFKRMEDDGKNRSGFAAAMELVHLSSRDKIISNPTDHLAVVYYNTRNSKNETSFPHIYVYQDLDEPSAQMIKKLESVSCNTDNFTQQIGSSEKHAEFHKVLWTCASVFAQSSRNANKRIFLFTNIDDPNHMSSDATKRSKQKAKDLEDLGIQLELFPTIQNFDSSKFYQHIVPAENEDDDVGLYRLNNAFKDIEGFVRMKSMKKRCLLSAPLQIGNFQIAIKMYCLLRTATKTPMVFLDSATNQPLTCSTRWACKDTGEMLEEYQIKTFFPYGDEKVFFNKDEMNEIKDFGSPGLVLLGFKPIQRLKVVHNIKSSYFVYPDESKIQGSMVAFNALLTQAARKGKMAIARLIYRKASIPRFVALLPQLERVNDDGFQLQPPGFNMIFLPYADDMRELRLEATPIADTESILKAKLLVSKLRIRFCSENFPNPSLQKFYATLQAMALEEDLPDSISDYCTPDLDGMKPYAPILRDFSSHFFGNLPPEEKASSASRPGKRKAVNSRSLAPKKAAPMIDASIDWRSLAEKDQLAKKTVPDLKAFCKSAGLMLTGKKADLIERIREHFKL